MYPLPSSPIRLDPRDAAAKTNPFFSPGSVLFRSQKISVIYYITGAIKYCIATLIMLLFDFQGWFIALGAICALIVVVVLSYLFGRSGIMGKV